MSGAVGFALAAFSAVSAVKALSEGDIMGAIMGGFGAYMGFAGLGTAFGTATMADATALTSGMAAPVGTSFADMAAGGLADSLGSTLTSDIFSSVAATPFSQAGGMLGSIGSGLSAGATPYASMGLSGSSANLLDMAVPKVGFMDSLKVGDLGGMVDSVKLGAKELGNDIVGSLTPKGDGTFIDQAGSIFDEMGELVGGKQNLFELGKMAYGGYQQDKAREEYIEAGERQTAQAKAESARKRRDIGYAPKGGFGTRGRS